MASARAAFAESVPPLRAGDVCTRNEFEHAWRLHPEIKKAELIDGMVYIEMTVGRQHARTHARLNAWLMGFESRTANVEVLDNVTIRLGEDDLQPDALLRVVEGGTSAISDDDCVVGPPELVAEVAVSSRSYDRHKKLEVYRRGGVPEYICWQAFNGVIDWWTLEGGLYRPIEPDSAGVLASRVFPGLRLDSRAMIAGDMRAVLGLLGQ